MKASTLKLINKAIEEAMKGKHDEFYKKAKENREKFFKEELTPKIQKANERYQEVIKTISEFKEDMKKDGLICDISLLNDYPDNLTAADFHINYPSDTRPLEVLRVSSMLIQARVEECETFEEAIKALEEYDIKIEL